VSRQLVLAASRAGHVHTSELARWDQVFPKRANGAAELDDLIVAGVRAAVLAPEQELTRWFSWSCRFRPGLVDDLVEAGRLERPEPG
jgi:hypothetical protein